MRRPQDEVSVNIVRRILTIRKILRVNVTGGMRIANGSTATARAARTRTSGGTAAGAGKSEAATTATARGSARRRECSEGCARTGGVSRRGIGLRQTPAANRLSQSGVRTDY